MCWYFGPTTWVTSATKVSATTCGVGVKTKERLDVRDRGADIPLTGV